MRIAPRLSAMLLGCLLASGFSPAAEAQRAGCLLRLAATTTVTVTLPADPACARGEHFYRNAAGVWLPLKGVEAGAGTVTFALTPDQMAASGTTVILDKPAGLDLTDTTPPRIVTALIDGREVAWPAAGLDLGWVEVAPKTMELHIADDRSAIDPASLTVAVNGKLVSPGHPGVRLETEGGNPTRATLFCDVAALLGDSLQGTVRIAVACDDRAIDDQRLETRLAFTATASPRIVLTDAAATAANGIKVVVDSTFAGYGNIACLADGQTQTPGTTTYGVTWASAETSTDHWACLILPAARRVSGLEIAWANYSSTFWSSARYDILTWDGSRWQRALRVPENPEARTSRHEFAPRTTDRVLIWVPASGNHPRRPDMTWITELTVIE